MVQSFSTNVDVNANEAIPFNTIQTMKGCDVNHTSPTTYEINKCGLYLLLVDATAATDFTIEVYVNGVPQAATVRTGTNASIAHTIIVPNNNCRCNRCSSPTIVQVMNTGAVTTFSVANSVLIPISIV
jgi:hypothetical protein